MHSCKPRQPFPFFSNARETDSWHFGHATCDDRNRTCLQVWWFFLFMVAGEVQLCINSRVDHLSRPEGCDLNFEGLEPYHAILHAFVDASIFINYSSPLVSCVLPLEVRFGSFTCRGRFWLSPCKLVGCVRRFCPPPLLVFWSVFGPSSVRFFFSLALSGFARSGLGVFVLVFSLFPLLFCVPCLVSRLSSCHLIFVVISFPFTFHLHLHLICRSLKKPRCCGACVWTIWRE